MAKIDLQEIGQAESRFFEFDPSGKIVNVALRYDTPQDIFDPCCVTAIPMIDGEFWEKIGSCFTLIPEKHKLALTVRFADMDGYTEAALLEIFRQNFYLELKRAHKETSAHNRLAHSLILIGLLFFMGMMLIERLWEGDSLWRDVFFYITDIATTVAFWEALTMLIVEQREKRKSLLDLRTHFDSIRFEQEQAGE